jgi:hypothetical protein
MVALASMVILCDYSRSDLGPGEVPLDLTSGSMWLLFYSSLVMQSDCSGWDLWSNGDALDRLWCRAFVLDLTYGPV